MTHTLPAPSTAAAEIAALHGEIVESMAANLDKAIRIGELLTEQKAALPHGAFGKWIAAHLPFSDRTARNYMRFYRERDRLKTETVSDLGAAYKLLAAEHTSLPDDSAEDILREALDVLRDDTLRAHERLQMSLDVTERIDHGNLRERTAAWSERVADPGIGIDELLMLRKEAMALSNLWAAVNLLQQAAVGDVLNEMDATLSRQTPEDREAMLAIIPPEIARLFPLPEAA